MLSEITLTPRLLNVIIFFLLGKIREEKEQARKTYDTKLQERNKLQHQVTREE